MKAQVDGRAAVETALVSGTLWYFNEKGQRAVVEGVIEYHPVLGYGSTVSLSAMLTAYTLWITKNSSGLVQKIAASTPVIGLSIHEFFPFLHYPSTFDPLDFVGYTVGSAISYGVVKALSRDQKQRYK